MVFVGQKKNSTPKIYLDITEDKGIIHKCNYNSFTIIPHLIYV